MEVVDGGSELMLLFFNPAMRSTKGSRSRSVREHRGRGVFVFGVRGSVESADGDGRGGCRGLYECICMEGE